MVTRHKSSYQEGSIERVPRAKGPDVWVYRWRELQPDGSRLQRKKVIGDVKKFPTKSDAKKSIESFRAEVNAQQERLGKLTVGQLWGKFQQERFPADITDMRVDDADEDDDDEEDQFVDDDVLSPTTIKNYKDNFKCYILPEWKDVLLEDVRPFKVQRWLKTLTYVRNPTKRLAPGTKAKIRNQMSALFSFAKLHDHYVEDNPITPVTQSAKRRRKPVILSLKHMVALLAEVSELIHRVALLIAGAEGLRRSEIRGLKWRDIDFDEQWIHLRRGVIGKMKSGLKTEASRAGLPLQPELAEVLMKWREETPHSGDSDWVLASPWTEGKTPIWLDTVLQKYIQPAAKRAGIEGQIGWHTFRRSLASLLVAMKEHPKVAQELLRHANPRITMELYAQADQDSKRAAQKHTSALFVITGTKAS